MALPALPVLTSLFGIAMLLLGAAVCLVSARHVRRTVALARAETADRIDGLADGTRVRVSGTVRDGRLDPLVISAGTPARTLTRLSKTSLAGLLIGVVAIGLGAALLVVG